MFYSEGGSLPFLDSNYNMNDDFYWGRFLSVTNSEPKWVRTDQGNYHTVCQYHGILRFYCDYCKKHGFFGKFQKQRFLRKSQLNRQKSSGFKSARL